MVPPQIWKEEQACTGHECAPGTSVHRARAHPCLSPLPLERLHLTPAQAQSELGRRYEAGDGVQKDRNAALLFLKLAADQGLAAAQNSLAEILCARQTRCSVCHRELQLHCMKFG